MSSMNFNIETRNTLDVQMESQHDTYDGKAKEISDFCASYVPADLEYYFNKGKRYYDKYVRRIQRRKQWAFMELLRPLCYLLDP